MTDLTVVSLFDGIGGFPLAFERAGARTVATVEIDKPAAAISGRHFPDAHQFDDVTKVTGNELRAVGFVPDRGVVTAGWPCQDLSVAGRREGLAGARSGLWWEVVRLLDETHSRWFVGENVPGLLSSNGGRDMAAVVGALGELGYGFAYRVLDAQWFGVPQRRRRVFFVGHLGEPFTKAAEVLFECESGAGDSAQGSQTRPGVACAATAGVGIPSRNTAPPLMSRMGKGVNTTVDEPLIVTEHTHTHTHRSRRFRAAGNADIGSTPNQQPGDTSSWAVAALTSNGVGTCGADDNQAQAGHLIVQQKENDWRTTVEEAIAFSKRNRLRALIAVTIEESLRPFVPMSVCESITDKLMATLKPDREDGECGYCHAALPGCRYTTWEEDWGTPQTGDTP